MVIENISKELFMADDKNIINLLRDNFCNEILVRKQELKKYIFEECYVLYG